MLRDLYQKPADPWPEQDLKLARWAGMEKMVENAILHDYYAGDRAVPASVRLASMVRLAVTLAKAEAKRLMPFIERRNARWHFKQVLKAAGKNS
jgi:hypothetical protein